MYSITTGSPGAHTFFARRSAGSPSALPSTLKLRASDRFVRAGAYVTTAKQARIRTAASLWLAEHETQLQPRFDVIEIYGDADTPRRQRRINQIENAFE